MERSHAYTKMQYKTFILVMELAMCCLVLQDARTILRGLRNRFKKKTPRPIGMAVGANQMLWAEVDFLVCKRQ